MSGAPTIHANCVMIGESGVLIRGASGSGKSALSEALIALAAAEGLFARLVADDRVRLLAINGRLIASPPRALEGLIERRGFGIAQADYLSEAVVRTVIDIEASPDRSPAASDLYAFLDGVLLVRIPVRQGDAMAASMALSTLRLGFCSASCDAGALAFAPQHGKMTRSAPHASANRPHRAGSRRDGQITERSEFCAETA